MASLVEELIEVMENEKQGYDEIRAMSNEKREAIVHGDLGSLEKVTAREEDLASNLKNLENKRARILKDMAVVLGKDGQELSVDKLTDLLDGQPQEQERIIAARDALVASAKEMKFWNDQNQILLKQAIEMVEFDLNLYKNMRQAPETANYNRNAYNTGDLLGSSGFDSKQ